MKSIVYDDNFFEVQRTLGKRPGDYKVDPYYLRRGHGSKPYFWNDEQRRWVLVHPNDKFYVDDDGNVTLNEY